jgi:hypothetical protein
VTSGQTWSLLTLNSKGIEPRGEQVPLTIEAQYVVGFNWARQPGVRATVSLKDGLSFAVSAENPQTTFYNSGKFSTGVVVPVTGITGGSLFNSANTLSLNRYPDGIAKAAYDHDFDGHHVHVEASGVIRDLYAQQTVTAGNATTSDHATGGGVGGGLILGVIPKMLDLQVSGLTGRGIGRYGSGQLPDASFGVNGQIHPIQEWELMFGGVAHVGTVLDVYAYAGEERESAQNYTVGQHPLPRAGHRRLLAQTLSRQIRPDPVGGRVLLYGAARLRRLWRDPDYGRRSPAGGARKHRHDQRSLLPVLIPGRSGGEVALRCARGVPRPGRVRFWAGNPTTARGGGAPASCQSRRARYHAGVK